MATPVLGLTQPEYLSDGETAVGAVNTNFTIIDGIYSYFITDKLSGDIVTSKFDGRPVIDRLAIGG